VIIVSKDIEEFETNAPKNNQLKDKTTKYICI
jgi:hypothetical protein